MCSPSSPTASGDENVLQFDEAMAQFDAMFPHLGASAIETVLRKYDGNVSATIDELLQMSADGGGHEGNAATADGMETERKQWKKTTSRDREEAREHRDRKDPCANDEKIALLVQNREFLRYLRRDPNFQRELLGGGGHHSSNHRHHNCCRRVAAHGGHHSSSYRGVRDFSQMSAGTSLVASSRHSQSSPNSLRHPSRDVSFPPKEAMNRVPDGPRVEFRSAEQQLAIPQGPMIDYIASDHHSSGWTQRLKAKLSTEKTAECGDLMPSSSLVNCSDEELRSRIGAMGRGGKGLLLGLARKFGQMAKGGTDTQQRQLLPIMAEDGFVEEADGRDLKTRQTNR